MMSSVTSPPVAPGDRLDRAALVRFLGSDIGRYAASLEAVAHGRSGPFHWPGFVVGPLWAAWRRCWLLFWPALAIEVGAYAMLAQALFASTEAKTKTADLAIGVLLLIAGRLAIGRLAHRSLWQRYVLWLQGRTGDAAPSKMALLAGAVALLGFGGIGVLHFGDLTAVDYLGTFPAEPAAQKVVAGGIDRMVDWMTVQFDAFFAAITVGVRELLELIEAIFIGLPWPIVCGATVLLAWRLGGWKVATFAGVSLLYLGLFGYWEKSMSTLSLVGASAFFCIAAGAPLGILCGKRPRLYNALKPVLDFMQVMPTFVYLIPAVAFFSIGKPPGVLATVIFAMPPMIRLTALGIQLVPESVREAGVAFGATPWQLLAKVELPLAVPSIMTGINQTIMMSLSMVIVASMIGAGGLGYDVLVALRHLKTGEGFLAGLAIVVCAMMLDRIIQGDAGGRQPVKR